MTPTSKQRVNGSKKESVFDIQKIDAQLQKWREKLIDLTKSNPLLRINYSRVSKLQVIDPNLAELFTTFVRENSTLKMPLIKQRVKKKRRAAEEGQQKMIEEEVLEEEPEFTLEPGDITFDKPPKELWRLQRRLYDNARVTVEERGVTTLHLVFGALHWDDPNLEDAVSPLVLVPCELEYNGPNSHMKLKMLDEEIQLNPALELILRDKHKVQLPPLPEESEDWNIEEYLRQVEKQVTEQGWKVSPELWLSTFSFDSLAIYKDLEALAETAHQHPLIAALARASGLQATSEALSSPENLDEESSVPVPALDADSSQLGALTLAAAGNNLVVHGPPGTGKSQTITNLIADALGRGQKVLFVSAKMAALNVVHDRLVSLGLGRFCLEAHSTKAGKSKIIEELKRTLNLAPTANGQLFDEQQAELQRTQMQLNAYVKELHAVREPMGVSLYQALGKVEKWSAIPDLRGKLPWDDIATVTREQLRESVDLLRDLASQASIYDNRESHPWSGFTLSGEKGEDNQERLRDKLEGLLDVVQSVANSLSIVNDLFVISGNVSINKLLDLQPVYKALGDISELPASWSATSYEAHDKLAKTFSEASAKIATYHSLRDVYDRVTSCQPGELITLLTPLDADFKSWTRVTKPAFWKWRSSLRSKFHPDVELKMASLHTYLQSAKGVEAIETWFEDRRSDLSRYVLEPLKIHPEKYQQKSNEFLVAAQLVQLASNQQITFSEEVDRISLDIVAHAKNIVQRFADPDFPALTDFITSHWPGGFVNDVLIKDASLDSVVTKCKDLLGSLAKAHEWTVLQTILKKSENQGLGDFIRSLDNHSAQLVPDALQKKFYRLWSNDVMSESNVLQEFKGSRREEYISHFHNLDRQIRKSALARIQAVAAEPARRVTSAQGDFGSRSEAGILFRELQKRRNFKPLRKLFSEIPHVLQALKPCLLMSPTSVSTFLKPGLFSFDLIVFDEASQLPTQEAIAAILRSQQVVVAGDENQLPPTTFFDASTWTDTESEDEEEPLESLLNDCCAIYPVFADEKLVWHYRSKDERLIKFSNHYIYNNGLITFPSASIDTEGRGVRLAYVPDGTWDRGKSRKNRTEARMAAKLVIEQFEKYPERSLGVVAMNVSQKEAVEEALDEFLATRPHLTGLLDTQKKEPFFVKSLENVQGDERDTIIISVGYAKTPDGALSYNFGPLNREGGWRRLNVLVTRAKWQTILVTSLRSQELGGINPNNRGAVILRNYIEYAEKGAELPAEAPVLTAEETNDFENGVAAALREAGCLVDEQVGASGYRIDLAVRDPRDPNRYLLAVECDGATYHSSRTARDRDMLRQEVLRLQGWKMYRLWSTDWFRDRENALQALLDAVNTALQYPESESVQAPPLEPPTQELASKEAEPQSVIAPTVSERKYNPGVPYQKVEVKRKINPDVLMVQARNSDFAKVVAAIVHKEGPIHGDVLLERLREISGLARAGANIMRNLKRALEFAENVYNIELKGDFIYGPEKLSVFRVNTDEVQRSIEQIAPEEISLAAYYLVEDQFGFARESLPKAIVQALGFKKATAESHDYVSLVVEGLIKDDTLRLSGHMLYLT